jgi:hypothetical protein
LKRVFRIEIETSEHCGGRVQVIASIEDAVVLGPGPASRWRRRGLEGLLGQCV